MSNMLEQAIVDATALRETALNSAKAALIEKYKDEFKNSVEKLLEQDEQVQQSTPPEQNMEMQPEMQPELGGEQQNEPGGDAFKNIPSSFLDGDEDELITIDFDQIEKQLADILAPTMLASPEETDTEDTSAETQPEETPSELSTTEVGQNEPEVQPQSLSEELYLEDVEELEEDFELEESNDTGRNQDTTKDALYEDELEEEFSLMDEETEQLDEAGKSPEDLNKEIATLKGQLANIQAQIAAREQEKAKLAQNNVKPQEDSAEVTEELQELDEELNVDIEVENLLSGYMGSHTAKKRELKNLELAAARDAGAEEERKKQEEEIGDLKEKLSESNKQNKKYSSLIEELKENLIILKEHTEKLSVSNAKLLYINKVFGNNSLNERQKQNIVESISKSSTVLEAKTIYETLQSTVETVSNNRQKQSLSEALERGSQAFISRPRKLSNDDNFSDRMKILAGISNNN